MSIKKLLIKRKNQIFAFNQIVTVTINDQYVYKLGNGEEAAINLAEMPYKINAKSCFGTEELQIKENNAYENQIVVGFKTSNSKSLWIAGIFMSAALLFIFLNYKYDFNASALVILFPFMLIFRNKKQLLLNHFELN